MRSSEWFCLDCNNFFYYPIRDDIIQEGEIIFLLCCNKCNSSNIINIKRKKLRKKWKKLRKKWKKRKKRFKYHPKYKYYQPRLF